MLNQKPPVIRRLAMVGILLAACQPQAPGTVEVTVVVPGTPEVVTRRVEVVVQPTATPVPQGGFVVHSAIADASTLNPILAADASSFSVLGKMYLGLVRTDAFTGETVGEVAEAWEVSKDGLTYTFHLRKDIHWSDGTPLTANDVKFTFEAVASDKVDTPRKSNVELVESVRVIDDYTLEVRFKEVDCTALSGTGVGGLSILPAHVFAADFGDIMTSKENKAPSVVSGPFMFQEWAPDDHVTLVRNPNYYKGPPHLEGWTYRVFADESAELAATIAGEVDVTSVGPQYVSVIDGEIAKGQPLQMQKFFQDAYDYIGFNLANPANPQRGWDDQNGNGRFDKGEPPLPQDPHPILGDVNVRRAIAQAVDYKNIINKVIFGQGVQAVANTLPAVKWAFNSDLQPYAFDLEAARATLEKAGWVDKNGDGIREKNGKPLMLSLMTDSGNEVHENIATIVKDNLKAIGIDVQLDILEFGAVVEKLLGQTFDMALISWVGLGSDPEDSLFWAYRNDDPGAGFNFVSYSNETVDKDLGAARSLPGCSTAGRGALYKKIQEQIHDDVPYVFLDVPLGNVVWNTRLQGIHPGPWSTYYNVEKWWMIQP